MTLQFEDAYLLNAAWLCIGFALLYIRYTIWKKKVLRGLGDCLAQSLKLSGSFSSGTFLGFLLLNAAFLLLVAAWSHPISTSADLTKSKGRAEIIFAMDVSRSMRSQDVLPSRFERGKSIIAALIQRMQGDFAGVLVFGTSAIPISPVTEDYSALQRIVATLDTMQIVGGGTSLPAALRTAALLFGPNENTKVICIVTDGESHTGEIGSVVDSLGKAGVHIFAIGVGTAEGYLLPARGDAKAGDTAKVLSRLEESSIKLMANSQRYYSKTLINEQVSDQFFSALEDFKTLRPSEKATSGRSVYYTVFLFAALILLLVDQGWRR